MAKRPAQAQSIHDAVIAARNRAWQSDTRFVQSWTNPDGLHNAHYALNGVEQFPDLIVGLTVDGKVTYFIEEVETADSVIGSEVQQWRDYAALPQPAWLTLVVPRGG